MGLSWKEVRVWLGSTSEVGVRLVNGWEEKEERHPRQRMARGAAGPGRGGGGDCSPSSRNQSRPKARDLGRQDGWTFS